MRYLFVLCVILFGVVYSAVTSENNGTLGVSIDGRGLITLGRKFLKPSLTLIGMAIQNQQKTINNQQETIHNLQKTLHVHPCGEWTPWSPCDASRPGYFGSQTRTRNCTDTEDADVKHMTTEPDKRLCEFFCPFGYNLTNNGFCIKLNITTVSMDKAVEQCHLDGGNLIHIDSQRKYDDVKSVLGGYVPDIHIDGRRKDATSPWEYKYGFQSAFLKWHPGHPLNRADFLCLVFRPLKEVQFDYQCSYLATILCEKVDE